VTKDGTRGYKKKEVATVKQKALQVLGNPKHTGRIYGVGSQMSWKHGFPKDSTSYNKHDRYKKSLQEKIEDKFNMPFENRFMAFIQNLSQEHGSPPLHLLAP
jgi:hypothetical protein